MATGQKQSLNDFNNSELKKMLEEQGQIITGNKGELVARLLYCDPQIETRLRVDVEECAQEGESDPKALGSRQTVTVTPPQILQTSWPDPNENFPGELELLWRERERERKREKTVTARNLAFTTGSQLCPDLTLV